MHPRCGCIAKRLMRPKIIWTMLTERNPKMRMIPIVLAAFVLAAFVPGGPAAAQSWEEYSYPDYAFTVAFPATPQVETTTYRVADNRSVPARVYTVRQNNSLF